MPIPSYLGNRLSCCLTSQVHSRTGILPQEELYLRSHPCMHISHSVMSDFVTPWTVTHQVPLSMEFSRQEYWSGLPFPSPGDLPNAGIKPGSPALQTDSLPSEPPGKLTELKKKNIIYERHEAPNQVFNIHPLKIESS